MADPSLDRIRETAERARREAVERATGDGLPGRWFLLCEHGLVLSTRAQGERIGDALRAAAKHAPGLWTVDLAETTVAPNFIHAFRDTADGVEFVWANADEFNRLSLDVADGLRDA